MKSMTGFGKSSSHSSDYLIDVTIRSVNGRYLEVKFHGPALYKGLEAEFRKRISQTMERGTVDVYLNRKIFNGSEKIHFNKKLAKKWLNGFNAMAEELGLEPARQAQVLLSVPDLVIVEDETSISTQEKKLLMSTIEKAVRACDKLRVSEGKQLKSDIDSHLKKLNQSLVKIKKLRDQTQKDLQKKYDKKLQSYDFPGDIDPQRVAQEIVFQIDRCDINEEIQRLESHLKALTQLIKNSGSIGKKMDFYAQELLREVNTIGSKSTSSVLTQEVVEAKGLIEKYREQVQNVE